MTVILLNLSLQSWSAQSGPTYYYYQGQKLNLPLDYTRLAVKLKMGMTTADPVSQISNAGVQIISAELTGVNQRYLVTLKTPMSTMAEVEKNIKTILSTSAIEFASPVFHGFVSGTWVTITPDILLRFKPEFVSNSELLLSILAPELEIITKNFGNMSGAFKLRSSSKNGFEVLATANRLAEDSHLAWSEPDAHFSGGGALIPNDPGFSNLWGILNTGQFSGTPDMDMDGDSAWDSTLGCPGIKILIIDTGVQQDHPDINQSPGADFTGEGGGGGPVNICDNHGTPVAGCVSGRINNGLGTVGIAPGCHILSARTFISLPACDFTWSSEISWTVDALAWGESMGVHITNNSNCYRGFTSNAIDDKYNSTYANGMIHFASACNDGSFNIDYPARIPVVNAVAALNSTGARASFSNYGEGLDFSAPGASIYTTTRYSGYGFWGGTSFASPYAAGVAALILSRNPGLTPPQVESLLQISCRDLGDPGYEEDYGWGFVNAHQAVILTPSASGGDSDGDGTGDVCDNCSLTYNPTQADTDYDMSGDTCDNCPFIYNAGQTDTDSDLRGDTCDNCPVIANSLQEDSDTDQVGNVCDICPNHFNPLQVNIKAGDANASGGNPNLTDIVYVVNYVFNSGPTPNPICRGDANGSGGNPNLTDIIFLVNYVFNSGPAPVKIGVCCL